MARMKRSAANNVPCELKQYTISDGHKTFHKTNTLLDYDKSTTMNQFQNRMSRTTQISSTLPISAHQSQSEQTHKSIDHHSFQSRKPLQTSDCRNTHRMHPFTDHQILIELSPIP